MMRQRGTLPEGKRLGLGKRWTGLRGGAIAGNFWRLHRSGCPRPPACIPVSTRREIAERRVSLSSRERFRRCVSRWHVETEILPPWGD